MILLEILIIFIQIFIFMKQVDIQNKRNNKSNNNNKSNKNNKNKFNKRNNKIKNNKNNKNKINNKSNKIKNKMTYLLIKFLMKYKQIIMKITIYYINNSKNQVKSNYKKLIVNANLIKIQ